MCPRNAREAYNVLKGLSVDGEAFIDLCTGKKTTFLAAGDPLTGSGSLDYGWPGDRYFNLNSGPFDFAPGDTQEVVFALVVGNSVNQLSGIASLRTTAPWLQYLYSNNFESLNLPVNLYHSPLKNVESTDFYNLQLSVEILPDFSVDQTKCYTYYSFDSLEIINRLDLTSTDCKLFTVDIPASGHAELLRYYFEIYDTDGNTYKLPLAGPNVYFERTVGPDESPPEISTNMENYQTIFFNSSMTIDNTIKYRDRFPVDTVFLEVKIDDGDWTGHSLNEFKVTSVYQHDTNDYVAEIYWLAPVSWQNVHYGIVYYRIVVDDASNNKNRNRTGAGLIEIGHLEEIGDFSQIVMGDSSTFLHQWDLEGWRYFNYDPTDSWGMGILPDQQPNYGENLNSRLTYSQAIPNNDYSTLELRMHSFHWINSGDTAFVEISESKEEWTPIYTITDDGTAHPSVGFTWQYIFLHQLMAVDTFYISFRFQSDENSEDNIYGWFINRIQLAADTTLLSVENNPGLPQQYSLKQNYPNPFNPTTTISYELPKESFTEIRIYNLAGQLVQTLLNEVKPADQHQIIWDAGNLPSGIYFYQIKVEDHAGSGTGDFIKTKKCILLK